MQIEARVAGAKRPVFARRRSHNAISVRISTGSWDLQITTQERFRAFFWFPNRTAATAQVATEFVLGARTCSKLTSLCFVRAEKLSTALGTEPKLLRNCNGRLGLVEKTKTVPNWSCPRPPTHTKNSVPNNAHFSFIGRRSAGQPGSPFFARDNIPVPYCSCFQKLSGSIFNSPGQF